MIRPFSLRWLLVDNNPPAPVDGDYVPVVRKLHTEVCLWLLIDSAIRESFECIRIDYVVQSNVEVDRVNAFTRNDLLDNLGSDQW